MPFGEVEHDALSSPSPPGAASAHFAFPTPFEYVASLPARLSALTTIAGWLLKPEPRMKSFPAATTAITPPDQARLIASENEGLSTDWIVLPTERMVTCAPCAAA